MSNGFTVESASGPAAAPARRSIPVVLRAMRKNDEDHGAASTDVIFDKQGRGAHHRTKDNRVLKHHEAHEADPATIVRLSRSHDQIVWFADRPFRVTNIQRHAADGTVNPFTQDLPFVANEWNFVASGPLKANCANGRYKVTFDLLDGLAPIDPDFEVHDGI
jgi:hypothetical protein